MLNRQKFLRQYLKRFSEDYEKSITGFTAEEQICITETLLAVLDCYRQQPVDYKKVEKIQEELYKKYGKRLTNYNNLKPSSYFEEQSLKHLDLQYEFKIKNTGIEDNFFTEKEQQQFLHQVEKFLKENRKMLYLQTESKEEGLEGSEKTTATKGKLKREVQDNLTYLNQEQTALLIHYLQQGKIILKDEYLTNKQAGNAFSILTGYSADTLRQALGKTERERISHKKNLTELHTALNRIIILIERDLKGKK